MAFDGNLYHKLPETARSEAKHMGTFHCPELPRNVMNPPYDIYLSKDPICTHIQRSQTPPVYCVPGPSTT